MDVYTKSFEQFAESQAKGSSELYYFLSKQVIEDAELMEIIKEIPLSQPKPNLFFASMHFLVARSESELRAYYPSLTVNPLPFSDSFEHFKEFALNHKNQLIELFRSRLVQTNEVRRAAYLYPIFSGIAEQTSKSLTLIEIGTSAGLLLCPDAYNYEYIEEKTSFKIENAMASIYLKSENKGERLPNTIHSNFKINTRIGIDLNIVDLNKQDEYDWMLALIWPEHSKRRQQFIEASKIANGIQKDLYEGDLLELLPKVIQSISPENQIILFHTHVANQFPNKLKKDFELLLKDLSIARSFYHVYNNMYDADLHQDYLENGKVIKEKIFQSPDGHGRWFYWS
ncbi:DUF2332 domain-containing protein [Ureibacillus aquaedulcis]|uniref:DUF2332 domain-containing protein n=1 Tax=Ureibacillus aquaedulcis TaxID=3058421 RepID=A0ABT8GMI3_9BACL|nr:DUF2332 domain-containing protein [Ureibacillus sp. BA0131]MDN4492633.1 DUF2332 domain-containing protein [Ureibacillus sp. BA0131]